MLWPMTIGDRPHPHWHGWLLKGILIPRVHLMTSVAQFGPSGSDGPQRSRVTAVIFAGAAWALTATPTPTPTPTPTDTPTPSPSPTLTTTPVPTTPPSPTSTGSPTPVSRPVWDGVRRTANAPILMYHYISAPPSQADRIRVGLSVPPEAFDAQMKLLADHGFHTVTLLDVYEYLANGQPLPVNPVVITFDDGYVDNYQNAFPILQKYGMVGTFFVLVGPPDAGNPNYMTWDMLTEMSNAGMDIELHSRDHVDLRWRTFNYLFFQIVGGRQSIEGHTGRPVHFMAYPSGLYDAALLKFLTTFDFWAAVTTNSGHTHTLSDALTWTRIRISGQLSLESFAKAVGIR